MQDHNEDTDSESKPSVLFVGGRAAAHLVVEPTHETPACLGCWNDIERWWNGSAVAEVTHPQFGTCELPLGVRVVLQY